MLITKPKASPRNPVVTHYVTNHSTPVKPQTTLYAQILSRDRPARVSQDSALQFFDQRLDESIQARFLRFEVGAHIKIV